MAYLLNSGFFLIPISIGFSFFPFIIFLDYHKKEDWHISVIYLIVFYSCFYFVIPAFLVLTLKKFYIFLLIPIFIFGLALKGKKDH